MLRLLTLVAILAAVAAGNPGEDGIVDLDPNDSTAVDDPEDNTDLMQHPMLRMLDGETTDGPGEEDDIGEELMHKLRMLVAHEEYDPAPPEDEGEDDEMMHRKLEDGDFDPEDYDTPTSSGEIMMKPRMLEEEPEDIEDDGDIKHRKLDEFDNTEETEVIDDTGIEALKLMMKPRMLQVVEGQGPNEEQGPAPASEEEEQEEEQQRENLMRQLDEVPEEDEDDTEPSLRKLDEGDEEEPEDDEALFHKVLNLMQKPKKLADSDEDLEGEGEEEMVLQQVPVIFTKPVNRTKPMPIGSPSKCFKAPTVPRDRRKNTTRLTFTTFNAEMLFMSPPGALKCPGTACKWKTPNDARLHIKQVASILHRLDADIVQLNEVGDCSVLHLLVQDLVALGDHSYKVYMFPGADSATGESPALLTRVDPITNLVRSNDTVRLPVFNSTCPDKIPGHFPRSKGVSKNFVTTFNVTGFSKPITLIGAHLLAQPTNVARCVEREGQAKVLANIAHKAVLKGHHAIISGDMNDWSRTAVDRNGNTPISSTLSILESNNFKNVGTKVLQSARFSDWWDKDGDCKYEYNEVSALDHVIVSPSLRAGVIGVSYRHDLYQGSCTGYNSDHFPLKVTFKRV